MEISDYANSTLAWRALCALKQNPFRVVLVDRTGLQRKLWRAAPLLAAAATLAAQLPREPRIGIVLPPGAGGWLANLAVALAGQSSVNLNFTASIEAIEKSLAASGIKTVITAAAMRARFPKFPWNSLEIIDLPEVLGAAHRQIFQNLLRVIFCPALAKRFGVKEQSPDAEATLLFSSGSTGTPKGVPLTHRNLLTNLAQIDDVNLLPPGVRLMACLPLFHSFALTTSVWYSLTHPIRAISYPTPLEPVAIGKIVQEERADIMIGAPSFYKIYLRQIPTPQFTSLRAVVAGAEKTPAGLHTQWQSKFGSQYLEGYGLTETSPVVSVNVSDSNKIGSVGKLLKGMQARVVDFETGNPLNEPNTRGILELKGDNVFDGYLNDPETNAQVLHEGWLWTGDVATLSADGYLTIDGRLKRFSKIAGEMISHTAVEAAILAALGLAENGTSPIAVTGVTNAQKGEALVIVSQQPLDMAELRKSLEQQGLPNLWIPKRCVQVEALPYLPSGKLDLQKLGVMAAAQTV